MSVPALSGGGTGGGVQWLGNQQVCVVSKNKLRRVKGWEAEESDWGGFPSNMHLQAEEEGRKEEKEKDNAEKVAQSLFSQSEAATS